MQGLMEGKRLMEGSWQYSVDEKGRFPIPPKIRKEAGEKWVWGLDGYEVVLLPQSVWEKKLASAKNPDKIRLDWHPFEEVLDSQGRISIPAEIRELGELGDEIILVSMSDRLLVKNAPSQEEMVLREAPRPFQSGKEAEEWLRRGDNVAYFSRPDRIIVGRLTSGNGTFFTLDGKDKNGILVGLHQIPYCNLYPLRPKETRREDREEESLSDKLLDKFPDFNPDWPDKKKKQWFDDFLQLVKAVVLKSG